MQNANVLVPEEKLSFTQKAKYYGAMFMCGMCGVGPMYAATTNQLFDKLGSFSEELVKNLDDLYCNKLFPLLFIVACICWAFTKDERKKSIEWNFGKGIVIAFAVIRLVAILQASLVHLTSI